MRLSRMISSLRSRVDPPPKSVRDIRKAVLRQGAGRRDHRRRREARAQKRRQAEKPGQAQRARADQADDHARDRCRPGDAVEVERRALAAGRGQSGEEAQRVADIASGGAEAREALDPQKAQRNMATASTPIAAKPDSTRPHCRTSARAAETSRPRSDRIWLLSGAITKKA